MIPTITCADCQCSPAQCISPWRLDCNNCTKQICCCKTIHRHNPVIIFTHYVKSMFAAALGIEILCITAAEIGENSGLYLFGYHILGIAFAYIMGFVLAGFTTFMTILGRYEPGHMIDSCCSVLEQSSNKGFLTNLLATLKCFGKGISRLPHLHHEQNLKHIMKTSLIIMITAESACIIIAETVDLIFYKQSILLSIPLALLAGSFVVVAPEAYRKMKGISMHVDCDKSGDGFISLSEPTRKLGEDSC